MRSLLTKPKKGAEWTERNCPILHQFAIRVASRDTLGSYAIFSIHQKIVYAARRSAVTRGYLSLRTTAAAHLRYGSGCIKNGTTLFTEFGVRGRLVAL